MYIIFINCGIKKIIIRFKFTNFKIKYIFNNYNDIIWYIYIYTKFKCLRLNISTNLSYQYIYKYNTVKYINFNVQIKHQIIKNIHKLLKN